MNFQHSKFPNSFISPFLITSPQTWVYNCIAYAYGVQNKWIWPVKLPNNPTWFWPPNIPNDFHIDSFIKLFESIGYAVCPDGELEAGFNKVAIFTNANGEPTHAAKQLNTGIWSSKLGPQIDVSHSITAIENGDYGHASVYMRRPT